MSTTIDSLDIQIRSSAGTAATNIEELARSLEKLKNATNINKVINQLGRLKTSLDGLRNVNSGIQSLERFGRTIKNLGQFTGNVSGFSKAINTLRKLPQLAGELKTLDLSGFSSQMQALENGMAGLSGIANPKGLTSSLNALKKIPEITNSLNTQMIDEFGDKIEKLSAKLAPLAIQIEKVGNGFAKLPSRVSQAVTATNRMEKATEKATKANKKHDESLNKKSINLMATIQNLQEFTQAMNFVGEGIGNIINDAMQWDGIQFRFGRAFGEDAEEVLAYSEKITEKLGINQQQFMQYSSMYGSLLSGFGMAQEQVTTISVGLAELSYDIWAAYNDRYKSLEDASEAVRSAITGEIEPIRNAGIALTEASMQEYLDSIGMATVKIANLSEAQKSEVRYATMVNAAMNQGIVGTYAAEMNTAEGVMRNMAMQTKTLSQAFGSLFIPVLMKVIPWVTAFASILTDAIRAIASFFGIELQKIDWGSSVGNIGSAAGGVGDIADNAKDATGSLKDAGKEAKKLKDYTMGFDELNVLNPPDESSADSSGGSGGAGGVGTGGSLGLDFDTLWDESVFEKAKTKADEIKKQILGFIEEFKIELALLAGAFGALGIAKLLSNLGDAISNMGTIQKLASSLAILTMTATLVFKFAENYLEGGSILNLLGEAVVTAAAGYLMYKGWGVGGLAVAFGVSAIAQLVAIETTLGDGGVKFGDMRLWLQSAFTTATGAGALLAGMKVFFPKSPINGASIAFSLAIAGSLVLSSIAAGEVDANGLNVKSALTGLASTALAGLGTAGLVTFLGVASAGTGFLIGIAVMGAINLFKITVETSENIKEEINKGIDNILFDGGGTSLDDISKTITIKLSAITEGFGDFETYRNSIDTADENIKDATLSIENMADAIGDGSAAFDEYVPKIVSKINTLHDETKLKLEAIRSSLIEALAGGLGEGLGNVDTYVQTVNGVIDATLTELDKLEIVLMDSAKAGSQEWYTAWEQYKTLVGESKTLTDDFATALGGIDWSKLKAEDGSLDSGALKEYFSGITSSMETTKGEIETYYSGIATDLETLRTNAVNLYGEGSEAVVKIDTMIDTNQANWDNALAEVEGMASGALDQLQYDLVSKTTEIVAKAQEDYKNLSWWEKLLYPTEETYVDQALSNFKNDYVGPIETEMEGLFNQLGIDGSTWATGAIDTVTKNLFNSPSKDHPDIPLMYKTDITTALQEALKGAEGAAIPQALAVAESLGLNLATGIEGQYTVIYDSASGAVAEIYDSVNDKSIEVTPELKDAMETLGMALPEGVLSGASDEMGKSKANFEKLWWKPWTWFKTENDINSPSKLFYGGGENLTDGLFNGSDDKMQGLKSSWQKWSVWPWNWFKDENKITSGNSGVFKTLGENISSGLFAGSDADVKAKEKSWKTWSLLPWNWFKGENKITTGDSGIFKTLGEKLSGGLFAGSDADLKVKETSWKTWSLLPWNWFKTENGIQNGDSTKFSGLGKKIAGGLLSGVNKNTKQSDYTGIFSKLSSWFSSTFGIDNGEESVFAGLGKSLIGNLKTGLSSAWSGLKTWWENLELPSFKIKTPHISWSSTVATGWIAKTLEALGLPSSIPKMKVEWYANGGFPDMGQMFIAREAGPELVGSINGRTAVANNDQIVTAVSQGVYSAVMAAMGNNNGSGEQHINVYLDGKQITASVEKRQAERGRTLMGNQLGYGY